MPDLFALLRTRPYMFAAILSFGLLAANIIAEPSFGEPGNWPEQLAAFAPLALVALASTPQVVSGNGGVDISIGPVTIFVNIILVTVLMQHDGLDSWWVGVPILLLIGGTLGAANGFLISYLRYQPVIATVCTFFILSGVNLTIGSETERAPDNWTESLTHSVGPIPGALLLLAIPALVWFGLSKTRYHRALYSVGGNDVTAFASGVDVAKVRFFAFVLGGVFAAVAGIAVTALLQSSSGSISSGYTLIALAAVALGGTSFGGGRGGLICSFLGAASIYLIQTLLSALSVPPSWLQLVYGLMLVVGVVVGAQALTRSPSKGAPA